MAETSMHRRVSENDESYRLASEARVKLMEGIKTVVSGDDVRSLTYQAIAYVWGRQDQGGAHRHTNDDWRFSSFYGLHCLAYAKGEIGCRLAIRNAFEEYLRAGTVNGVPA